MKAIVRFLDLDIPTGRVTAMFNGEIREYSLNVWRTIKRDSQNWESGLERVNQFAYKFNSNNGRGLTPSIVLEMLQGKLSF